MSSESFPIKEKRIRIRFPFCRRCVIMHGYRVQCASARCSGGAIPIKSFHIEVGMNKFYRQKNPGGRYGSTKGVQVPKPGQQFYSKFLGNDLDVASPNGFIYPILGAFRALVEEKDGQYRWKKDPFAVLEKVGADLVESTVSMSRSLGNNPQSVGKEANIWKTLYMTVAFETMA